MKNALLQSVIALCHQAGKAILEVYHRSEGMDINTKADDSPVTAADLAAHALLAPGLQSLLEGVPVLSEEGNLPDFATRSVWDRYWLIDPLDGTKEFIRRNGEFTVNVALIEQGAPVLGVVHVPVTGITYAGIPGEGAIKLVLGQATPIHTRPLIPTIQSGHPIEVVASRRHGTEKVDRLLERVAHNLGEVSTQNIGSSLKLCLIAEGKADFYPRLAPTCEWDTAAAQAVVEAAGGMVLNDQLKTLRYNHKDGLLNPDFFVIGDPGYDWWSLLSPPPTH